MKRLLGAKGVLLVILLFVGALSLARPVAAGVEGAPIYNAKCKPCHGATGAGDTAMGKKLQVKDLRSPEVQKLTDEEMATLIGKGKNKMPAFEKQLPAEKIRQVIAYVRSLARN